MSSNLLNFAKEISELTGQPISVDHIYPAVNGRWGYTQAPEEMAPMLLHHWEGVFCIDMTPNDYAKLKNNIISAHEYITTATWLVGYFWGGKNIIGGGYYQPIDIIENKDALKRYLTILKCRGYFKATGHMPTINICRACKVQECPFSFFKGTNSPENEVITEYDPRIPFFRGLNKHFQKEFPKFTINKFMTMANEGKTVYLLPNGRYKKNDEYSFNAYISEKEVLNLMMRKNLPEDWNEYAKEFTFKLMAGVKATQENLAKALSNVDYTQ